MVKDRPRAARITGTAPAEDLSQWIRWMRSWSEQFLRIDGESDPEPSHPDPTNGAGQVDYAERVRAWRPLLKHEVKDERVLKVLGKQAALYGGDAG